MELCPEIRSQWGLIVEGRGRDEGRYGLNQVPATGNVVGDVHFGREVAFGLRLLEQVMLMRAVRTGLALLCAAASVAACSSDASPPTGGTSGPAQFTLVRADGDSLPALDSGDSVASTTGVEYREIYLERGTLTLLQDPPARFETLLHYAQYAVTQTAGGRRLDLRGVLDFRDHGTVTHDAQGNLLLTSDLDPSVVHVATADSGGYGLQYRFSNAPHAIALLFRPADTR